MSRGKKGTRDPELTEKQFEQMAQWLSLGLTVTDVCQLMQVSRDTFYKWAREGKQRTDPNDTVRKFADAVARGKMSAKANAIAHVAKGMSKDWKAAAWYLGVTHPREFGPKVKVTLEAEYSAALERLKKALPEEFYEKALDALAGGDGEEGEGPEGIGEIGPRVP